MFNQSCIGCKKVTGGKTAKGEYVKCNSAIAEVRAKSRITGLLREEGKRCDRVAYPNNEFYVK